MTKTLRATLYLLLFLLYGLLAMPLALLAASSNLPLLQASDLQYQGAFRVPTGKFGSDEYAIFDFSDEGLAYNANHNSLFIKGHIYGQLVAEISIPAIVNSSNMNNLKTATVLQNFAEITEGHLWDENIGNGMRLGGLLVYNLKLIGATWAYYDGAGQQTKSHFTSGMTLATSGDFHGLYTVGNVFPAFVGGDMTTVPSEWQSALGGPALTGHCCTSIISHQSLGPSAWVFDPDKLGVQNPVPATPVVEYPIDHPTLGTWEGNGSIHPLYNMSTLITGIVFPPGMRSVLFFGRTGTGTPCYGCGGSTNPGAECANEWCYDPVDSSKGTHVYPYSPYLWAYDVNDFIAVKNGTKNPWDISPYYHGALSLPFDTGANELNGAAYDPVTQRIYVAQKCVEGNCLPVIHVFKANVAGGGGTTQPAAPTRLRTR